MGDEEGGCKSKNIIELEVIVHEERVLRRPAMRQVCSTARYDTEVKQLHFGLIVEKSLVILVVLSYYFQLLYLPEQKKIFILPINLISIGGRRRCNRIVIPMQMFIHFFLRH